MQKCPFCSNEAVKARIIEKNRLIQAFPTNIPIVSGHVLIAPVRHVPNFFQLTESERKALFIMLKRIQGALRKKFRAEGFNIAWNEGESAGQSVPHFHLHVLPRRAGDAGITSYEPRKFLYRPGSREESPESELRDVADTIRKSL